MDQSLQWTGLNSKLTLKVDWSKYGVVFKVDWS